MSARPTIGLTGVTGHIGGELASTIADLHPTLLARDPSRAPHLPHPGVRRAAYDKDAVAALRGIDVLFMVSATESPERRDQHRAFVGAAAEAGVRHIVYTSFAGASSSATFTFARDHADTEQAIRDSGMAFTFLRDNFYLDLLPYFADDTGTLRGPAADGRVAAVARHDVAESAAAVLRDPGVHAGAIYTLTGPDALSISDVARRAGSFLGKHLRFENESVEEAYASRRAGYPDAEDWQLDAWVSTYTAIADGSMSQVSPDVATLLGRPAMTLEECLLLAPAARPGA